MQTEGKEITSSQELGERLGISSAQIRKDLSQFGEFGKQGTGYNIGYLGEQLKSILKVDRVWDVVLVGVGDLGRAVANYAGFLDRGFRILAVFDNNPEKIGKQVGEFNIRDVSEINSEIQSSDIQVAMITVPSGQAQKVADQLVEAGIRAILCYAPTSISVPSAVRVQYIDPVLHLQGMTYHIP
jgi:redox-sensing transcriptional repressor